MRARDRKPKIMPHKNHSDCKADDMITIIRKISEKQFLSLQTQSQARSSSLDLGWRNYSSHLFFPPLLLLSKLLSKSQITLKKETNK